MRLLHRGGDLESPPVWIGLGPQIQSALRLGWGWSCKTTFSRELWTSRSPLYWMNPSWRNLFMKVLTRDRVVPTISASISWLTFPMTGAGAPSLPKFAIRRSTRARRFSLELNSWSTKTRSRRQADFPEAAARFGS